MQVQRFFLFCIFQKKESKKEKEIKEVKAHRKFHFPWFCGKNPKLPQASSKPELHRQHI